MFSSDTACSCSSGKPVPPGEKPAPAPAPGAAPGGGAPGATVNDLKTDPSTLPVADVPKLKEQLAKPGCKIVDFRATIEFEVAPLLAGAISVPSGPDTCIANVRKAVADGIIPQDKDTPIITHCSLGRRGSLACAALMDMGYTNVINGGTIENLEEAMEA
uniref:Rhodanese domain-containing protein n=1 Tax=Guillardia theta TaxID=55529 RepID=A0A6U6AU28_GUITH|mmetsp:Transcript_34233/g.107232  ORF Transcript_34233/g.107232 Transcript_34233/m.107232 type:complete len:160 (+) Transcript_34233:140-619(+)